MMSYDYIKEVLYHAYKIIIMTSYSHKCVILYIFCVIYI